jgi:hypothetical protein
MNTQNTITQDELDDLLGSADYIDKPTWCKKSELTTLILSQFRFDNVSPECSITTAVMKDVQMLLDEQKK